MTMVKKFLVEVLQLDESNFRFRAHDQTELAHYSTQTVDVEFDFPFG